MRYNPENGFVELDVNELLTSFGSIGTKTNSEKESIRTAKRDKLAFEHGIFFSPDAEFKFRINVSGIHYEIYGKADGILRKDGKIIVYIIRSAKSLRSVISLPPITEAKGLILSHFAAEKFSADTITLRTVIIETETGNESIIDRDFSASSLSRSFMGMLLKKERFAKLCINRATDARASIRNMSFPFGKMREGQRELIEECYRAIHSGKRLFASAPTGIGKTISVLYPSVKALGDGLCDKIFYLTAKGSTRREAFSSVKKMFDAGAELKVIMLSAKETMCANDAAKMSGERLGSFCPPDKCGLSRGYYSRNEDALYELLTMGNGYTPALISKVARKHSVCPYELSLDLSEHCDVIICDYNYVLILRSSFAGTLVNFRTKTRKIMFSLRTRHIILQTGREECTPPSLI
ncbi:MAG: hypothetical protein U0M06_03735 [Clostridia bacterium]|nr:hypothetical protein [Clostridia bacterium]